MRRKDYLRNPVNHIRVKGTMTVDQLMRQFENSGSFGAGRLDTACDIYEKMLRDRECNIFLGLLGRVVPEEDYVKLDYKLAEVYSEIADERKGEALSSSEFAWELGKRIGDSDSILRAAYEENVPIFMPAVRDSEFGFIHWLHSAQQNRGPVLQVDAFKDVPTICEICGKSPKNGMIVIGGGVPRNTIQSSALASKKGLDYAVVITMDRPEAGGLSGSTVEETVRWGKMKRAG